MKLSCLIFGFINLRIRNGLTTRFWTDNWTPYGDLRSYLTSRGNSFLGIPGRTTVASLYRNNNWTLPPATQMNDNEDYYEWETDGWVNQRYNTEIVYGKLCEEGIFVPWYHSVWNKSGIPRHSFPSWLFVSYRFPTKDRILGWGLQTDPSCVLCNSATKSRNHLLFNCRFTWHIWQTCSTRCGFTSEINWDRVMEQLQSNQLTINKRNTPENFLARMYVLTLEWEKYKNSPPDFSSHRLDFTPLRQTDKGQDPFSLWLKPIILFIAHVVWNLNNCNIVYIQFN